MDESNTSENSQNSQKPPRVRDLFEWQSLSRPNQKFPKEFVKTISAIALLLSIIFAFFQEWLAIFVTWAAVFLGWALTKIEPENVGHKITTEGIVSMDHAYLWQELGPFWFTTIKNNFADADNLLLHIAHRNIFGELVLIIHKENQEKIKETLAEYLPYIEVPEKTTVEKLTDWFTKKFPFEPKVPKSPQNTV